MKKIFPLLILVLGILACNMTPPPTPNPTPTFTPVKTVMVVSTPAPACLIVTAAETLHLRKEATEHSQALDWLPRGLVIEGMQLEGNWWKVEAWDKIGYVNTNYVERCDNGK